MRAVVWTGNNDFELREVTQPAMEPGQVLVQVKAASICTTDFHYANFGCVPPIIPGHEAAGVVVEKGVDVKDVKIGQRVALDPVQRCGRCKSCREGYEHLCLDVRHLGDTDIPGGWGEYVAIDAQNAHKVAAVVSWEAAALTEPAAVCLESFKRADFQKGQTVLILGDGTFGFIHAMIANILGAGKVVVAGHHDERLTRIALKTGAVTCNTHRQTIESVLEELRVVPGVDVAVECTGATAAPNLGLRSLRPRGSLIIFSLVWKPEVLDLGLLSMKELNVLGSCRSLKCFDQCLAWMAEGLLDMAALVDIRAPLEDVNAAMEKLGRDKKNCFKAVLIP